MITALNPPLLTALRKRFGSVRISNEGQRAISMMVPDLIDKKKMKEEFVDAGEYYRVCCPYCNDSKYRLYVNHRWNTEDRSGQPYGKFLIHCFNERCDMANFDDELKPYVNGRTVIHRPDGVEVITPEMFKEVDLPGQCQPLAELPDSHPALRYIATRERETPFDPRALAAEWGLSFCYDHPNHLVKGRIIVPFYRNGKLVGWQARVIGEHHIKYYTMPGLNKRAMFYNGDRARHRKLVVVVEGVFDAFSVGPCAVALLGKSMTYHQRQMLIGGWGDGAAAIMLDGEAVEDIKRTTELFSPNNFKRGVFPVYLPKNADPGKLSRETNWKYIEHYAKVHNVDLKCL